MSEKKHEIYRTKLKSVVQVTVVLYTVQSFNIHLKPECTPCKGVYNIPCLKLYGKEKFVYMVRTWSSQCMKN